MVFTALSLLFLTLADMTRYEGWLFIPLWSAFLYWKTRDRSTSVVFLAALLLFPVFWTTGNYLTSGDPLIGFHAAKTGAENTGTVYASLTAAVKIIFSRVEFQLSTPVLSLIVLGSMLSIYHREVRNNSYHRLYLSIFLLYWFFMLYFAMLRGDSLWSRYLLFGAVISLPLAFLPFNKLKFSPAINLAVLCIFAFLVFQPVYQEMSETPYSSIFVTRIKPAEIEQVAFWLKESDYKSDYLLMTPMGWRSTYLPLYFPEMSGKYLTVTYWRDDAIISSFIEAYHPTLLISCDCDRGYIERVEKSINHNLTREDILYNYKDVKVFQISYTEQ